MGQQPEASQNSQGPTYTLSTTTRLVVLDVVVLDKKGKPVTGLDKSQFTVTEDGKEQRIRSFDPPSSHTMPEGSEGKALVHSSADLKKVGNAPLDILVFDEINTTFADTSFARVEMERYLKAQPEVLPRPTLFVAAGDSKFVVLHDYTQSRAELEEGLKKHTPQLPWQLMRSGNGSQGAIERMAQTLGVLSQIADASSGARGRKNVIWVGSGYPSVDTTTFDEDDQEKMLSVIRTVTDRMLAARVTLYMIDPSGVHAAPDDAIASGADADTLSMTTASGVGLSPFEGKLEFSNFANATGGEVFFQRNDLDHAVQEGLAEGAVYYTLTYSPTSTSDVKTEYRKIHVALKDPSLHAVTRDGYYPAASAVDAPPAPGAKTAKQLQWDMAAAAQTSMVYTGLDVEATRKEDVFGVRVLAKGLTWHDEPDTTRNAEVTILVVCYGAKDKQLLHEAKEMTESIHATDRIDGEQRVLFPFPLKLPAGTQRVRFVVRDAGSGKLGSVEIQP